MKPGKENPLIITEPLYDPFKRDPEPDREPEREPDREPDREPARVPEKVGEIGDKIHARANFVTYLARSVGDA